MDEKIKEQVAFVLKDDCEIMTAALDPDSGLDAKNKEMNRMLIAEHEKILEKVNREEELTMKDLVLIRDANEIHLNDVADFNGHYKQAVVLNEWLETMMKEVG